MSQTATQLTFNQEGFDAFLANREEPAWLTERRKAAFEQYLAMEWPARRSEEWMRTDVRLFKAERYAPAGSPPENAQTTPGVLHEGVQLGGSLASIDSRTVRSEFADKWREKGVIFGSLGTVASEHPELVEKYLLTKAVDPSYDRYAALHAAFWSGGAFLYVPRGVSVDEPFHTLSTMTDGGSDFGHILVYLEEGAEATLLAEKTSNTETDGGFHCGAVELLVAPGANLRFVDLQNWGKGVWHFGHQKALVDRDAQLQWTLGAIGSRVSKVNQEVALVGKGANCQVNGVLFTEGKQHISYHTQQHHVAESCRSDFLYKTALQDHSRTVWRGMIKVDEAAQKTDGYQRNDNLLLSADARADSIPGLEIEADDVRCTHGSTSGDVDEELIFYCQCRGFTRQEAIRTIVTGFFQQIFDRISIESVRNALGSAVARRVRDYE